MTDICITVTGADGRAIQQARRTAEAAADLIELRLDLMDRPDPAAALSGRTKPAIVTCRPPREGGRFDGPEEERLRILRRAHELGAEFIDLEWDADAGDLIRDRGGRGIVMSRHIFSGTPCDAGAILDDLRTRGADVAKLAVMTGGLTDLLPLLALRRDPSSVVIGMGDAGLSTRILASRFGSRWTYAGEAVAPGQITAARLLHEFHFRRITSAPAVYGVLGHPVTHSLSPAMHNAGLAALGIEAAYVPLDVTRLDGLKEFAHAIDLRGLSVTIPFKLDVLPLLDEVAPEAQAAGAVNTIAIADGRWVGWNTDAEGFLAPLRRRIPSLTGVRASILGAGGAARAAGLALLGAGAIVTICARRPHAAQVVADAIGARTGEWPPPRGSWDLLVNATPVGSRAMPDVPVPGPFDGTLVYDLVYDPDPTALMQAARHQGCSILGGLEMLVAQAERQFEIWTGQRPPAGLFSDAAASAILARHPPHPNGMERASERERNGVRGAGRGAPATEK